MTNNIHTSSYPLVEVYTEESSPSTSSSSLLYTVESSSSPIILLIEVSVVKSTSTCCILSTVTFSPNLSSSSFSINVLKVDTSLIGIVSFF